MNDIERTSDSDDWKYTVTSVDDDERPSTDEYFDETLGLTPTEWLFMLVPAFAVLQIAMFVLSRDLYWYEGVGVLAVMVVMYPLARYRAKLREQFVEEKYE